MRLLFSLDRLIGWVLNFLVAGMMLMTFIDVVGRELFAHPLIVAPELTTIGLAAMVFIGLPMVSLRDEHITISLFENLFKGRAQRIKLGIVALLLAGMSAVLSYQLWIHAGKLGAEVMMFLQVHKSYICYGESIMSGITVLAFLTRAAQHFTGSGPERANAEAGV
jgi:TRAP-type C4-dicarboxylate transport system permease small subunit